MRRNYAFLVVLKTAALLAAVEWWVRGPFVVNYVAPKYSQGPVLRERTGGTNISILFDELGRRRDGRVRVAMVGDSTLKSLDGAENTIVPSLLQRKLRQHLLRSDIDVVDAANVGLYAGDAALVIAKLLASPVDLVVYDLQLRALQLRQNELFATKISSELGFHDVFRLIQAGGAPWLARYVGGEKIVHGFVYSNWATYAYRGSLREFVWQDLLRAVVLRWPSLQALQPATGLKQPSIAPRSSPRGAFDWTRDDYEYPNQNWEALELIERMCEQDGRGRCLIFLGPVNPVGRDRLAEPGLYEAYQVRVASDAFLHDIMFRDYSDTMNGDDFQLPRFGLDRDAIHPNESGRMKLAELLVEPVARAIRQVRQPKAR